MRGEAITIPVGNSELTWHDDLRDFVQSFHGPSGPRVAYLRDPRMFEAYIHARALLVLVHTTAERESIRWFDVNYSVDDGGWAMYQIACEIGPGMVRWLAFVGKSGFWRGLHSNLGQRIDAMLMTPAFSSLSRNMRSTVGYCATARPPSQGKPTNHCDMRFPTLPPFPAPRQRENATPACLRLQDINDWVFNIKEFNYKRAYDALKAKLDKEKRDRNVAAQSLQNILKLTLKSGTECATKSLYTKEEHAESIQGRSKHKGRILTPPLEDDGLDDDSGPSI